MDYHKYIKSNAWRAKKHRFYKSKQCKGKCWCCGIPRSRTRISIHHVTYKRLGAERLTDLIEVCPDCHTAIHCASLPLSKRHHALRRVLRKSPTVYVGLVKWYNLISPAVGKKTMVRNARLGNLPVW